jgi:hypothetical protein
MPTESNKLLEMGIHLVSSAPESSGNKRRLRLGDYFADIVSSKRDELRHYYVVQRDGSAGILEMELSDSFDSTEIEAERALQRWSRQDLLRQKAS